MDGSSGSDTLRKSCLKSILVNLCIVVDVEENHDLDLKLQSSVTFQAIN